VPRPGTRFQARRRLVWNGEEGGRRSNLVVVHVLIIVVEVVEVVVIVVEVVLFVDVEIVDLLVIEIIVVEIVIVEIIVVEIIVVVEIVVVIVVEIVVVIVEIVVDIDVVVSGMAIEEGRRQTILEGRRLVIDFEQEGGHVQTVPHQVGPQASEVRGKRPRLGFPQFAGLPFARVEAKRGATEVVTALNSVEHWR
jgi:hypothetical protein